MTDLTQSRNRSLVASLRAPFMAHCSSLFTSTIWILDLTIALVNLQTTQRLVTRFSITDENRQTLQEDLSKISVWSDRWEMPFNVDKCQVLQVGTRNKKFDYEMRGVNSKAFNVLRTWGSKSRHTANSYSNASMQQIKRTECWASLRELFIQE